MRLLKRIKDLWHTFDRIMTAWRDSLKSPLALAVFDGTGALLALLILVAVAGIVIFAAGWLVLLILKFIGEQVVLLSMLVIGMWLWFMYIAYHVEKARRRMMAEEVEGEAAEE